MELEFWATTDVGRVRDHNEDNFLVDKRLKLFVVCDGMGGHAAGEVASAMSVKIVREVVSGARDVLDKLIEDPDNMQNRKAVQALLEQSIQSACSQIWHAAQEDQAKRGMGTTCSLLLLQGNRGFIGHVGDSRIYLLRQQQVHQITEDHSLVNEMLRLGKIKPGEEHKIPHRNAVTRAVGVNEFVEVDTFELDVFKGDQFLLCSDGLCGYFPEQDKTHADVRELIAVEDIKEATERCINFANGKGGKDNITSIIVRVTSEMDGRREMQQIMEALRSTPFFHYLSYKEMVQVVNMTERIHAKAGDVVIEEGRDNDAMMLVIEGEVALSRNGTEFRTVGAAQHYGESAIIDEDALAFTGRAVENAHVLLIRRANFLGLLRDDADLAVKLLWNFLQTFTIRLREHEVAIMVGASAVEEPTPPTGSAFEEDLRVTSAFGLDDESEPDAPAPNRSAFAEEEPTMDHAPLDMEELQKTLDMDAFKREEVLGDHLAWEKSPGSAEGLESKPAGDDEEDDLRATVKIGSGSDEKTQTLPTLQAQMSSEEQSKKEPKKQAAAAPVTISGESTTKSGAPKAQVLKRTKLIVGSDEDVDSEQTQEAESLAERLRKRRDAANQRATKSDSADS